MIVAFLRDALRQAAAPDWRWLAIVLLVLVTATNMVILSAIPEPGATPSPAFIAVAAIRILGLLLLSVALLRRAMGSPRAAFMPDTAFWVSVAFSLLGFGVAIVVRRLLPGGDDSVVLLVASNVIGALITAPLAAWMVALATERPLAINPRPRMRGFSAWLIPLVLGQLLIVVPLAALHAHIDGGLVTGTIERLVWLEIVDGAISAAIVLVGLALAVTVYRRVAKA